MAKASFTGKDYKDLAQGFGVCTIAVFALYLISGMHAVNLRETSIAVLMSILTACAAFYVTSAFIKSMGYSPEVSRRFGQGFIVPGILTCGDLPVLQKKAGGKVYYFGTIK